ncbi:MAG TPA: hypothetical protein VMU94_06615 [Streptosporangiaceae bacterium]|nr:hypothetical protein [Streptosporangiaceae bacterium]
MAGFADLDVMQRARRLSVGVVMLVLGGVVGYALPQSNASPSSETGSVTSVGSTTKDAGLRFSFTAAKGTPQNLRLQDATPWQKTPTGRWYSTGQPTCLAAGSTTPVKVTLGVVTARAVGSAPGRPIVVWVECYG